jgi:hypothetical protein
MLASHRFTRPARTFLLLCICLLALSALPARQASAAVVTKKLDDSLVDFTRGSFQRASLSAFASGGSDQAGAVQLMPVSVIKNWFRSSFSLPEKLSDLGAVTIGNHIFTIGGQASDGVTTPAPTANVWSVQINPTTGAPSSSEWFNETQDLPSIKHSDQFPALVAARTSPAVAAAPTGPDSGYIYVIGGRVRPSGAEAGVSSYAVSIGTVVGGHITGWVSSNDTTNAGLRIPADLAWGRNGVQSASAITFGIGGKTYVYLIGGLQRFRNGPEFQEVGSKQVYYAQVRSSDGMLVKPSSPSTVGWDTLASLPVNDASDVEGLWDATAVAGHFEFGDAVGDALYVSGGQILSSVGNDQILDTYNNATYRAKIGANGTLTWSVAPNPDPWTGTLPMARVGMGGVEVNGKLYLAGGRPIQGGSQAPPEAAVLASVVEDDLKLAQIGVSGSNFLFQNDALRTPIAPRTRHGMVKVQIPQTTQTADAPAYVYVIAGQGTQDDGSQNGSDTLIYAKVGGDEDVATVGFAPSGWYYSTVHETNRSFTGEQVQEINWTTTMTSAAMDIQLQYRISTDNDCTTPTALNSAAWQDIDGVLSGPKFSVHGANGFLLGTPPPTHCFQYRARLSNGSTGIAVATPALLNVSIKVVIPGSPDLKVDKLPDARNLAGKFTGLSIELLNHYDDTTPDNRYPTQPANIESSQPNDSFFVDLFVFGPGETVVAPTPPIPSNATGNKACATVAKSLMTVDAKLPLTQWYDLSDPTCSSSAKIKDILPLFTTPGHYVVFVVVDSYDCSSTDAVVGCVGETSPGAEGNNVKRLEFDIANGGVGIPDILLPRISRWP